MATKDYANRTLKGNKKPRSSSKSKGTHKKRIPWLLSAIVILFILAFSYFLWSLKSDPVKTATPVVETLPDPHKTKEIKALPPKPKEQWTYLKELENKQVEVDLPTVSTKPSRPYQIQCASFRLESQADELRAKIAFQGLEAQVKKVQGTSGVWYKVILGPYERKRLAERQRHILQRGKINGCQIWLWEG